MFRLPYEQHRAAAQGSIASGLAAVHHAAIAVVPKGHDNLNRRLADGWRGIKDVKGFQEALELRIKAFIEKIDVSSDYEATIPGADQPWTGKIHFPRLSALSAGSPLRYPADRGSLQIATERPGTPPTSSTPGSCSTSSATTRKYPSRPFRLAGSDFPSMSSTRSGSTNGSSRPAGRTSTKASALPSG